MRVAIIGSKGIPCRDGGVERHVEELASHLARRGHRVFVYSRHNYTKSKISRYKGVKIIYTPCIPTKNLEAITHTFTSLIHVLFKKMDIIHIHSVGPSLLTFIPKIFKKKTKIIVTFHSRDRCNEKWSKFARLFLALGEWTAINSPHLVITVSRNLYHYCRKKYPQKNIFYVPNGATVIPKLKAKEIKKWQLEENNYLLLVARLIPLKGIHYLIRAFKKLNLNKKLVIAGDSQGGNKIYEEYLKKLADHHPNIIFTGHQQGKILAELFSNAYLYILPSEVEGLSISLLEAMGTGRCCLVSDIPENQEVIQNVGYTFKSKNVNDLAQKILFLDNHPELVLKNGKLAKEHVQKFYNWPQIVNRTLMLYHALIENEVKVKKYLSPQPVEPLKENQ